MSAKHTAALPRLQTGGLDSRVRPATEAPFLPEDKFILRIMAEADAGCGPVPGSPRSDTGGLLQCTNHPAGMSRTGRHKLCVFFDHTPLKASEAAPIISAHVKVATAI